jgi:predicted nucleic acid-binding protein
MTQLGPGEAEVIALASELEGSVPVLLDDRKGRRIAREHHISVVGSVGVLILAKDRGLVPAVRPVLRDLQQAGLYLSDAAARELLAVAAE